MPMSCWIWPTDDRTAPILERVQRHRSHHRRMAPTRLDASRLQRDRSVRLRGPAPPLSLSPQSRGHDPLRGMAGCRCRCSRRRHPLSGLLGRRGSSRPGWKPRCAHQHICPHCSPVSSPLDAMGECPRRFLDQRRTGLRSRPWRHGGMGMSRPRPGGRLAEQRNRLPRSRRLRARLGGARRSVRPNTRPPPSRSPATTACVRCRIFWRLATCRGGTS